MPLRAVLLASGVALSVGAASAGAATVRVVEVIDPHSPDPGPQVEFVAAPGERNHVEVAWVAGELRINDSGADLTVAPGCRMVNAPHLVACQAGVEAEPLGMFAFLADGDDFLSGGPGPDVIRGGPGDDFIDAGRGPDLVFGDDGDDVLRLSSGQEIDELHGGTGRDLLRGDPARPLPSLARFDLSKRRALLVCDGGVAEQPRMDEVRRCERVEYGWGASVPARPRFTPTSAVFQFQCPSNKRLGTRGTCRGRYRVAGRRRGSARFSVTAGQRRTVRVPLRVANRATRRYAISLTATGQYRTRRVAFRSGWVIAVDDPRRR